MDQVRTNIYNGSSQDVKSIQLSSTNDLFSGIFFIASKRVDLRELLFKLSPKTLPLDPPLIMLKKRLK